MRKVLPWIYLALAVLGAVLPWRANLEFIAESGGQAFDLPRFIADASSTAAARSLSSDLLIGASAISLWICNEGPRLQIRAWWVASTACSGLAFPVGVKPTVEGTD